MYKCELCGTEFLTSIELEQHIQASIERGKKMGGKFALLARILEGDIEAEKILQHLIDARIVGPGWDNTPSNN